MAARLRPHAARRVALAASVFCGAGCFLAGTCSSLDYACAEGVAVQENRDDGLECEAYCRPDEPGGSVIEFRVDVALPQPSGADLRARAAQTPIEVTVYGNGFERGLFTRANRPASNPPIPHPSPCHRR